MELWSVREPEIKSKQSYSFILSEKKVQTDAHAARMSLVSGRSTQSSTQSTIPYTTMRQIGVYHNKLVVTRSHVASKVFNLSGVSNLIFEISLHTYFPYCAELNQVRCTEYMPNLAMRLVGHMILCSSTKYYVACLYGVLRTAQQQRSVSQSMSPRAAWLLGCVYVGSIQQILKRGTSNVLCRLACIIVVDDYRANKVTIN